MKGRANDRHFLAPLGNRTCRFPASGSYGNSRSSGGSQVSFEMNPAKRLHMLVECLSFGDSIASLALVTQVYGEPDLNVSVDFMEGIFPVAAVEVVSPAAELSVDSSNQFDYRHGSHRWTGHPA